MKHYLLSFIPILCLSFLFCSNNEIVEEYYPDGNLMTRYFLKNGKRHGPYLSLSRTGDTLELCNYRNGIEHGKSISSTPAGMRMIQNFKSGRLDGFFEITCAEKNIRIKLLYKDGIQSGKSYVLDRNGEERFACIFKNGSPYEGFWLEDTKNISGLFLKGSVFCHYENGECSSRDTLR